MEKKTNYIKLMKMNRIADCIINNFKFNKAKPI